MGKIDIDNLVIEVTRRCNLECKHCLRGEQEPIDMGTKYIEALFEQLKYINTVTFSGGEPSLKPEIIKSIIQLAEAYKVEIANFYIATNGVKMSSEFISVLMDLYLYCSDNEMSALELSNTPYHEYQHDGETEFDKVMVFRFARERYEDGHKHDERYLIRDGRAKENYPCDKSRKIKPERFEIEGCRIGEGNLYLNCLGQILSDCDLSYERQNKSKFFVCDAGDDLLAAVKAYNEKIEEA